MTGPGGAKATGASREALRPKLYTRGQWEPWCVVIGGCESQEFAAMIYLYYILYWYIYAYIYVYIHLHIYICIFIYTYTHHLSLWMGNIYNYYTIMSIYNHKYIIWKIATRWNTLWKPGVGSTPALERQDDQHVPLSWIKRTCPLNPHNTTKKKPPGSSCCEDSQQISQRLPSRESTYPPENGILKMIFLFPRWDMWSFPGGYTNFP